MELAISNDLAEFPQTNICEKIFNALEGRWELQREIVDIGYVVATASFDRTSATTLHYQEQGTLTLRSGFAGQILKEYIYKLRANDIQIIFADTTAIGNTFLTLQPIKDGLGARAQDTHLCGTDRYHCKYNFVSKDAFLIDIRVEGANKSYVTKTHFRRC